MANVEVSYDGSYCSKNNLVSNLQKLGGNVTLVCAKNYFDPVYSKALV